MKTTMIKYLLLFSLLALTSCQSSHVKKQTNDDMIKRAGLHYQLGLDSIHKNLIPKAFEELYISDKIRPNQPDTLDAIAYAWRLRGDNKKARQFYERAIQADAGPATYNNYGSLLVELKEYPRAIEMLNISLQDPRYRSQPLAYVNLGNAYVGMKNLDEAVKSYRRAKMMSPNWTYPQLKEANAYHIFGRDNYAQALYETILQTEPANHEALAELIAVLKGKNEEALLEGYLKRFIQAATDKLEQAWAKDELAMINEGK